MDRIRVLLVDDHAVLRAGLRALLEAEDDISVVGEAATGEDAVALAAELRPEVVVMDLTMPGIGGLEAVRRITALGLGTRILALTIHREEECLLSVLQAGGSGYVTKDNPDAELLDAIRTVARGHVFLYPSATRLLLRGLRQAGGFGATEDPVHLLSGREREVLILTAEGYSSSEIGDRLQISPKTVDTYRSRIMEKLGLHHRSELVHFALQQGLLTAEVH